MRAGIGILLGGPLLPRPKRSTAFCNRIDGALITPPAGENEAGKHKQTAAQGDLHQQNNRGLRLQSKYEVVDRNPADGVRDDALRAWLELGRSLSGFAQL